MNQAIKKRFYLINNIEEILEHLAYYKAWSPKIRGKTGTVIWRNGEKEKYTKLYETSN